MPTMNETPKFLVYGLIDPRTNELRYVGKSSSGMRRPRVHQTPGGRSRATAHNGHWLRALFNDGGAVPSILVLEVCLTHEENNLAEIRLISFFKAAGFALTNSTSGGDGAGIGNQLRKGVKDSPEARAKKSLARMGNQCRKGIPHTPEMRQHLSEVNKGRVMSSEAREKIAASKRGVKRPEWVLQKMRGRKCKPVSEATRAAISKANTGRRASEVSKQKQSASMKLRWAAKLNARPKPARYIVYGLIDPRDNELRYVGKSTTGLVGVSATISPSACRKGASKKEKWLSSVFSSGARPAVLILSACESTVGLIPETQRLVALFRGTGFSLVNSGNGGPGMSGARRSQDSIDRQIATFYKTAELRRGLDKLGS